MGARLKQWSDNLSGHWWTVGPKILDWVDFRPPPPSVAWRRRVDERDGRPVDVTGRYRHRSGAETLVVIVHGLGGCADSGYCVDAARAVDEQGYASLRLSMRGADRSGDDLYHGGLWHDLAAAITDEKFDRYERIFLVGFSLGGHLALRTAIELDAPRLSGVAAVCSPLHLGVAQTDIDKPAQRVYREYILYELRQVYRALAERGGEPTPLERVMMAETLREWDALTVVPRFGFTDVDDYYETVSVAGELDDLQTRSLLVAAPNDPLVTPASIEAGLPADSRESQPENFHLEWVDRGGHVFFPRDADLGLDADPGLVPQILAWLDDT